MRKANGFDCRPLTADPEAGNFMKKGLTPLHQRQPDEYLVSYASLKKTH